MSSQTKACLYALATALMWSTVATAFKLTLNHLDPWQMVFWSVLTSTLLLGAFVIAQGKWLQLIQQGREHFGLYILLGFLNPFLYHIVLFGGYDLLPAQQAQALNYSWPLALTLLAVPLLGNKLSFKDGICCLIAYLGVVIISTRGELQNLNFGNPQGVILMLSSTLVWALYWILNARNKGDSQVGLLLCFLFGLPWITIAVFWKSSVWPIPVEGLSGALYIGLVEMGFAYIIWLKALKLAENTSVISNISYLSPFLSLIFIANILNESIHLSTYVGLVLIVAAVVFQRRKAASEKPSEAPVMSNH
ncbi:DMT family transporter [Endozoicomonas sp. 8E]|uniref:DMT family transporter n=1 Tax=Endozoicomonas sp. 8E TaxID=3035692 RepID=UPI002938E290|nr:DMT family transporter [Endozoicomonas sp. 8E]WOG26293.1 DMT family transporter [Endozoicomonas sp. 8E]